MTMRRKNTGLVSSWLCTKSTKRMFVKIVYPGGHVGLHERPILAAEIMFQNPKCCVAHPNVFQQPWDIVSPDTTLMLGQKFYVVPISTIRKLQLLSLKYSPSLVGQIQRSSSSSRHKEDDEAKAEMEKSGQCLNDSCFTCLLSSGMKVKAGSNEDSRKEITLPSSSSVGAYSTKKKVVVNRKKTKDLTKKAGGGSPKKLTSFDHWQPSLESITEE